MTNKTENQTTEPTEQELAELLSLSDLEEGTLPQELEGTKGVDSALLDAEGIASAIRSQSAVKALFSRRKNDLALAENDLRFSAAFKSVLNWLALLTSAETIRKEQYDDLTEKMLLFDEELTADQEIKVKFKRAFEVMQKNKESQKALLEECARLKENQESLEKDLQKALDAAAKAEEKQTALENALQSALDSAAKAEEKLIPLESAKKKGFFFHLASALALALSIGAFVLAIL